MTRLLETAELVHRENLCEDHYLFTFHSPRIVAEAIPGQIVNIKTGGDGVILRRPFGFARVDADAGTFDIIFRVVGEGTKWLAEQPLGSQTEMLGPLGKGFDLEVAGDNPVIIGGGVGIPPLIWVIEELHRQGKHPLIYLGGRIADHLFGLDEFRALGYDPVIATEDGSIGSRGFITVPLIENIKPVDISQVYVCGRMEMLRTLTNWGGSVANKIQVSLECKMACGFGVCLGCAVASRNGGYLHVCTDGPVFTMDQVSLL